MKTVNPHRAVFFLVILISLLLGLALAQISATTWIPYVLLGLLCLSLGTLLTLLFIKNAGISFSWPALLAMGLVFTLLFTGLFKRWLNASVPPEAEAVIESLLEYQAEQGTYPRNLEELSLDNSTGALRYSTRKNGAEFTLRFRPNSGPAQTYYSDREAWVVED